MKYTFLILTCFLMMLGLAGKTHAATATIWDTGYLPAINSSNHQAIQGMSLVWQAKGGLTGTTSTQDDWEIFAYDLSLGIVTQITDDAVDDIQPQTDGSSIVWQKHDPLAGNQVFLYQINSPLPGGRQISTAESGDNFSPDIDGGYVVWSRQRVDQTYLPREIMVYNVNSSTVPLVISDPSKNNSFPRIANGLIGFQQDNDDDTQTLLLYDTNEASPVVQPAPEDFTWYETNPQVDGKYMVFSRFNGGDREIYYRSETGGYHQLTSNTFDDTDPVISKDFVAWTTKGDIFLADISYIAPASTPVATVSGIQETVFTASWSALPDDADYFALDVSTDPSFQYFIDGFNANNVGGATQFTLTGLTPGVTYYYRVNAVRIGDIANFSQTVTVTLPGGVLPVSPTPPPPEGQDLPFVYILLLK